MKAPAAERLPGLVVDRDPARREGYATSLLRCRLAPLCFDDCAEALLWLEEDTPAAAIIDLDGDPALSLLLAALADRDVAIVKPRMSLVAAE